MSEALTAFNDVTAEILDGVDAVLDTLDDDTVNATPLPGTVNSVFALVAHLHGMSGFWGGSFIAAEQIPRDRESEFSATGTVAQARDLVSQIRGRLPGWAEIALTEGIRNRGATGTSRSDYQTMTPSWVLHHVLHELAAHLGHMQICRDVVTHRS